MKSSKIANILRCCQAEPHTNGTLSIALQRISRRIVRMNRMTHGEGQPLARTSGSILLMATSFDDEATICSPMSMS